MARTKKNATRKVRVPGSKNSIDKMKYEIANEFGVNLGASASSRDNGLVGGEITKRLVENGMNKAKNNSSNNSKNTTTKSSSSTKKRTRKSK